MRVGEKCVFVLAEDFFGGKLKAGHRYNGTYAGGDRVRYRTYTLVPDEIIPNKKPTVKKEKAPTASDYKNFGDLCFEVGVRYRDNWTSVISGKKFEEGDWNGLQAGHGCSRQYWDTRHVPVNCHAITSGENYQMSLGNSATILRYWDYVSKEYGPDIMNNLVTMKHDTTKLSIGYLKEDCKSQYLFLQYCVSKYLTKKTKLFVKADPEYYVKWRCENLPKKKTDGIMKVLKIIKGEM